MVEYLIGNFMVNSRLMTAEEFQHIVDIQDKVRARLGLIAVSEGIMSIRQADEVNFLQTIMDKKFGDIAVEKGFLTEKQVETLLNKQGNEYLSFIQTLVDEGIIEIDEVDAVMKGFQMENGLTDEQIEIVKSADLEKIVKMFIPTEGFSYADIVTIAVKTMIRCVDRHAYVGSGYVCDSYDAIMPVTQKLEGEGGIISGIADGEGGMCKAASIFGRLEMTELDEDVQDACGEILNCLNGLYASALSKKGIELELLPPEPSADVTFRAEQIFVIPIYIVGQRFDFFVTKNEWR